MIKHNTHDAEQTISQESFSSNSRAGIFRRAKPLILPAILFGICLGIIGFKHMNLAISDSLRTYLSLENVNLSTMKELNFILLLPIGGVIVVFFRQSLGIRMLGPFRPILIALGLQGTGIFIGLTFFVLVSLIILLIRPQLRAQKIPYSTRLSFLLCIVVLIELLMIFLDRAFGMPILGKAIYFPIIILCLAAEGLGKLAAEKGIIIAVWRGANTLVVAIIVYFIINFSGFMTLQIRYPEALFGMMGLILLMGKKLNFQLLRNLDTEITKISSKSVDFDSLDSNSESSPGSNKKGRNEIL